jgi:hypothetical protein
MKGTGATGRKNNCVALTQITEQLPEELTYQSKFRKAIAEAVSESDVGDVVKGIVARAKNGDKDAIAHMFNYVLGGAQPIKITQNNHYHTEPSGGDTIDLDPDAPGYFTEVQRRAELERNKRLTHGRRNGVAG